MAVVADIMVDVDDKLFDKTFLVFFLFRKSKNTKAYLLRHSGIIRNSLHYLSEGT